jgi:hypothetical protein
MRCIMVGSRWTGFCLLGRGLLGGLWGGAEFEVELHSAWLSDEIGSRQGEKRFFNIKSAISLWAQTWDSYSYFVLS